MELRYPRTDEVVGEREDRQAREARTYAIFNGVFDSRFCIPRSVRQNNAVLGIVAALVLIEPTGLQRIKTMIDAHRLLIADREALLT